MFVTDVLMSTLLINNMDLCEMDMGDGFALPSLDSLLADLVSHATVPPLPPLPRARVGATMYVMSAPG
jgi:hypothetical protein